MPLKKKYDAPIKKLYEMDEESVELESSDW